MSRYKITLEKRMFGTITTFAEDRICADSIPEALQYSNVVTSLKPKELQRVLDAYSDVRILPQVYRSTFKSSSFKLTIERMPVDKKKE